MRLSRGMLESPKCPVLKTADQMMARATTNAAAAANSGRHRTLIHSRMGNARATGRADSQGSSGSEMRNMLRTDRARIPTPPSTNSRREGWRCTASAIPMRSGATVTVPNRHAANQMRHTCGGKAVGSKKLTAMAAPDAPVAAPSAHATKNPSTWGTSSSVN